MADDSDQPEPGSCPACGTASPPRAHRCRSCGEPLTEEARTARSSNTLVVFILVVMGLSFATLYFMKARARARDQAPPPQSATPELGVEDLSGDRDGAPVGRVDPEVRQ